MYQNKSLRLYFFKEESKWIDMDSMEFLHEEANCITNPTEVNFKSFLYLLQINIEIISTSKVGSCII